MKTGVQARKAWHSRVPVICSLFLGALLCVWREEGTAHARFMHTQLHRVDGPCQGAHQEQSAGLSYFTA